MTLFDNIITQVLSVLAPYSPKPLTVNPDDAWQLLPFNELIFGKDEGVELGKSGLGSACLDLVTTSSGFADSDELFLIGNDLQDLKADSPYARVTIFNIDALPDDEDAAFKQIKDLEYIKYDVIPRGFMVRASGIQQKEQVRLSKKALKDGMTFQKIGNAYIKRFKSSNIVKSVKMFFITADCPVYDSLASIASQSAKVLQTLNHVMNDINLDCASCNLKPICDEVEGMRELHFKTAKAAKKR